MTSAAEKAYIGIGMEGPIARWYEKNTRRDAEEFRKLARRLEELLPAGGDVLEVAPGPGFLAVELARTGRNRVTGLDVSKTFVELGRENANRAGVQVDFLQGNASAMPFADESFDLLVFRAAFKNFSEPEKALAEMRRVLRPGGLGLVVDLRKDVAMAEIDRYLGRSGMGCVNRWISSLIFRFVLLKRAYRLEDLRRMLADAGFERTEVRANEIGMEGWMHR